ncbi:MAG: metalloregulator ArsR/SmtB family transcription factor [Candidatus Abyssubacteria bacterium]
MKQARLVKVFKALANENRLKILEAIKNYQIRYSCCVPDFEALQTRKGSICCVDELGQKFDMAQSTVSQHLKELHGAGLLQRHKKGQFVYYLINREAIEELAAYFEQLATALALKD